MKRRMKHMKPEDMACGKAHALIAKETVDYLKYKSEELKIPVSRLVGIAIENERDCPNPFNFPCEMPSVPYMEDAFVDEALKILRYIEKHFVYGVDLQLLVLLRKDVGINDKVTFMHGYRELLEKKFITIGKNNKTYPVRFKDEKPSARSNRNDKN